MTLDKAKRLFLESRFATFNAYFLLYSPVLFWAFCRHCGHVVDPAPYCGRIGVYFRDKHQPDAFFDIPTGSFPWVYAVTKWHLWLLKIVDMDVDIAWLIYHVDEHGVRTPVELS